MRRAWYSFVVLLCLFFVSLFSEFIANDRPLVIIYNGKIFLPVVNVYKGIDFGLKSQVEPDYKRLVDDIKEDSFVLAPPIWWGYNESNKALAYFPGPPNSQNWLGTDDRGRDVFVRTLYGFRLSLFFAIVSLFFALIIGTLIGGVQGYFGGIVDLLGQRFVEIWTSLPAIFVVILVVNVFEPSIFILMLVIGAFSWVSASYYLRGECLRLKNKEFAIAARSLGASKWQVFFEHIIPNALTPLISIAPFIMTGSIYFLSFLDYMGLGVQPPAASLGELLRQGREHFLQAWWLALYPFLALCTMLVLLNFIGEGVRKAFDPKANF